GASATASLPVSRRSTTTAVRCETGTSGARAHRRCTATVTDTDAAGRSVPTGRVVFGSDHHRLGSCKLHAKRTGAARCAVTVPSTTGSVSARYGGDGEHTASTASG